MVSKEKIQRIKWDGDIQLCYCSYEESYKPCSEFSPRNADHGFQYYCRACTLLTKNRDYRPRLPESVIIGSKELLEKLGYTFNSELSIHQQFLNKYFNDRI